MACKRRQLVSIEMDENYICVCVSIERESESTIKTGFIYRLYIENKTKSKVMLYKILQEFFQIK